MADLDGFDIGGDGLVWRCVFFLEHDEQAHRKTWHSEKYKRPYAVQEFDPRYLYSSWYNIREASLMMLIEEIYGQV